MDAAARRKKDNAAISMMAWMKDDENDAPPLHDAKPIRSPEGGQAAVAARRIEAHGSSSDRSHAGSNSKRSQLQLLEQIHAETAARRILRCPLGLELPVCGYCAARRPCCFVAMQLPSTILPAQTMVRLLASIVHEAALSSAADSPPHRVDAGSKTSAPDARRTAARSD